MVTIIWIGIVICISQSATMAGLNISLFSLSRLRLEVAVEHGDKYTERVLRLRKDANYTLATILWGNVSGRKKTGDDVIDKDIVLLWTDTEKRIITGSDILGRLLRKIVRSS